MTHQYKRYARAVGPGIFFAATLLAAPLTATLLPPARQGVVRFTVPGRFIHQMVAVALDGGAA